MDAIKFIEDRNRMCESFGDTCTGCPAYNDCEIGTYCLVDVQSTLNPTSQIAIVEKWDNEHPVKTRQSMFLEKYPESLVDDTGVLRVCPAIVSATHRGDKGRCADISKKCTTCRRQFWMQEVE